MRRIYNEDVQLIRVGPGVNLTPAMIDNAMHRAMGNKMYAKFYTDKVFIQINFARDGNISVASNVRTMSFVNDLAYNNRLGWTYSSAKAFIYKWMNVSRTLLY